MFSAVKTAAMNGIDVYEVHVEADVNNGLPMFHMVGYLASEVKESSERVRTAIRNMGIMLPSKKVTINLSPADVRKQGAGFDLPIAVSVLAAFGYVPSDNIRNILFAGELSLSGDIVGVSGILPMVAEAKRMGCHTCIVPAENAKEGAVIQGVKVLGVTSLKQVYQYLNGSISIKEEKVNVEELFHQKSGEVLDFSDINGQDAVKRAAEIAVSGFHNLLIIGPPGSGKTMIAKRIPTILPPLSMEESVQISKIYSILGLLKSDHPLIVKRPFRSPHHTISSAALTGGGNYPKPGEVSLADRGVLFLDEMTEFAKPVLEVLRQPLEDRKVHISRARANYVYPADFMLIASMNPCNCGYYPDQNKCRCSYREIHHYLGKISQPMLDRIDISIEAPRLSFQELNQHAKSETSAEIQKRVKKAMAIQEERYRGTNIRFNAELGAADLERYCHLKKQEQDMLQETFLKLDLSARAYHKILKVARTIADLNESNTIEDTHLAEAICYRSLDKKYWSGR